MYRTRSFIPLALVSILAGVGCDSSSSPSACETGEVLVGERCAETCDDQKLCTDDSRCTTAGYCVALAECIDDTLEQGFGTASAPLLGAGSYNTLTLCPGDEDWYAVNLLEGQILLLDYTALDTAVAATIEVLAADGSTVLASPKIVELNAAIRYQALANGTYYIRIAPAVDSTATGAEGEYSLDYSLDVGFEGTVCASDANEPNSTPSSAVNLDGLLAVTGTTQFSELSLCRGDEDHFKVSVGSGQVLSVEVAFTHAAGDLTLHFYDNNGTEIALSASTTDGEYIVKSFPHPELIEVVIVGSEPEVANPTYDLTVSLLGEACVNDESEPSTQLDPAEILSDVPLTDRTLCVGDDDWYQLDASPGQVVTADLSFDFEQIDLGVVLYRVLPDGTITGAVAGSNGFGSNEQFSYIALEEGPYLLRVYRSGGTLSASYDVGVTVSGEACTPDGLEPNDSFDSPAALPTGPTELSLCAGDVDWFELSMQNGQILDAKLIFDQAENDLGFVLYRRFPNGTTAYRTGSNSVTSNESILFQSYEDGDFVLYVYRTRGTRFATYTLNAEVRGEACVNDIFEAGEGNNHYSSAASVTLGNHPDLTLCVGDADYYSVNLSNGQVFTATITFLHNQNDLGMALYKLNNDGTITYRSGSNTLTDNETIVYQPFEDGEFILYVYRTRGTTVASYDMTLSLDGNSCTEDLYEPNNGSTDAVAIPNGASPNLSLCVGDIDWYAFDAANGQVITASIAFSHADNDLAIYLYKLNADGTITYRAGSNTLTDNETIIYQPFEDATFLMRVSRSRGTTVANYDLDLNISGNACVADVFESNNASAEAVPIPEGMHAGLTLCVGDSDWYSLELANSQVLTLSAFFNHAQNDLGVALYKLNADGTLSYRAGSNTLSDNEFIVFSAFETSTYLVYVYRTRGTTVANYDLEMLTQGQACESDDLDPNDHWLQAQPIVLGGIYLNRTLCKDDTGDYYDLGVFNQGDVITATASFVHAENDFGIQIYRLNADNTVTAVASVNTSTDDEFIVYTVPALGDGQTFIYRVYKASGTASGSYDMSVSVVPAP